MKLYLSIIFVLINCAVSTAQSYYFKSLDFDTGANIINKASIDKQLKNVVVASSPLLWHKLDSFNRYLMMPHFSVIDSQNRVSLDTSFFLTNSGIQQVGCIKLKQGGYLSYGAHYNSKSQSLGSTTVSGCIIKFSELGDTIFTKLFTYNQDNSSIIAVRQLNDSSIILVSIHYNKINTTRFLRIIKLGINFNAIWDSTYYYSINTDRSLPRVSSFVDAIEETEDGGLLIGTSILTRTADTVYHALLFKINNNGGFLWERKYEFSQDDRTEINKIIKLKDGNFLLVGYYFDNNQINSNVDDYIFLIKVSPNGELISKKLVSAYMYHYVLDALEKPNGDLLLAGALAKGINGFDYKAGLICLDSRGNLKWTRQYEQPVNLSYTEFRDSDISDIELANDGTIMAVGNIFVIDSTFPYNNGGNQDIIFLYTDSNGCVDPTNCSFTAVEEEYIIPYYFQAFPNPSNGLVKFSTNIPLASSARIKIYNSLGQLILVKEGIDYTEELDLRTFAKGMYVLEIQAEEFRNTQKLIIE